MKRSVLVRSALAGVLASVSLQLSCATDVPPDVGASRQEIIGGEPADAVEFRWAAVIFDRPPGLPPSQLCGGALIRRQWVVTSAFCVIDPFTGAIRPGSELPVGVGDNQLSNYDPDDLIEPTAIYLHPDFDPFTGNFDAALLKLPEPLRRPRPLRIIGPFAERRLVEPGDPAVVMGWGETETDPFPDLLHKVDVTIVDREVCDDAYADDPFITVTDAMLCAGDFENGGAGTCFGDSGGPLVVFAGVRPRLAGISSFGAAEGCALPMRPDGYTRATAVRPWIIRCTYNEDRCVTEALPQPSAASSAAPSMASHTRVRGFR